MLNGLVSRFGGWSPAFTSDSPSGLRAAAPPPQRKKMVAYLQQGYKASTHTTVDGDPAAGTVETVEHWSGRVDVKAHLKSFPMRLCLTDGAPLSPWHSAAIGEHQKAIDELKLARAVGQPEWVTACERRVQEWKERILETQ